MEKIGRFEIIGKLGRGAFGMVYKGKDPVINRLAAIKVMSEATVGDPELVARFKREAEAAGGLNHRNIVTIYDLGEHNGLPYIAMEFLEGRDLERILKERVELPMERKVEIIVQTAEGLNYAHAKGIVHRDIKPANIRVVEDGTVKIMDFGIAKMTSSDMTRTGQFMGTVNYMSPEQIKAKRIDGRSDIFALGVVFYELISYRKPFPGDSITAVIYKIVNENPPALTELHGTQYEWLEGIVLKCLEKDAAKRWQSCQELSDALRQRLRVGVTIAASPLEQTLNLARLKLESGDFDTAIRKLDEILEQDPDNAVVLKEKKTALASRAVKEADSFLSSGRLEQARDRLLLAEKDVGETSEIRQGLVRVEERIKSQQAVQMYDTASRYFQERRIDAALDLLQKARELDPYNERIRSALAQVNDEKRKVDVELLLTDAKARLERGQVAEAKERVEKAMQLDPHSLNARSLAQTIERELEHASRKSRVDEAVLQGKLALQKEDFERAIPLLEQAVALDARNADAQSLLAQARQERVKADEKKAMLEQVGRGKELLAAKQFDQARIAFEKALKLDPTWDEARLGIEAARLRATSIDAVARRGVPRGVLVGAGAALLVVAAILGYVLTRPSQAAVALRHAQAALAAGELQPAREAFEKAEKAPGKEGERAAARTGFCGLYEPFVQRGELLAAKGVLDRCAEWKVEEEKVRQRYRELAQNLGRRGLESQDPALLQGSAESYFDYFGAGYVKKDDYDSMKALLQTGEATLARADDAKLEPDRRLELYAMAQKVFGFVEEKDLSFNAFARMNEARAKRAELAEAKGRIDEFRNRRDELLKSAGTQEQNENTWDQAIESYDQVLRLVAKNQDLSESLDLERDRELAASSKRALEERRTAKLAAATQEQKVALLLGQAESLERDRDLRGALGKYKSLLEVDAANATARQKVDDLQSRVTRVDALKAQIRTAIGEGRLDVARERLAEASAISSDNEVVALQADFDRLQRSSEQEAAVAQRFQQAEALAAQGQLDQAEAMYRDIAGSTSGAQLKRASAAIEQIRLKKVEAQIQPTVNEAQALEGQGNVQAALEKWKEVERLNARYPGLQQKLRDLNRALNQKRIAEIEPRVWAAYEARQQDPAALDRLVRELRGIDPDNRQLARVERAQQLETTLGQIERLISSGNRDEAVREAGEAVRTAGQVGAPALTQRANDLLARARALVAPTPPPVAAATPAPVAAATPVPRPATTPVAVPPPVDNDGQIASAVASNNWIAAAMLLDQSGGTRADAGRIYFNASHAAACDGTCDLDRGRAWAAKSAQVEPGLNANRWSTTLVKFKTCDLNLQTACRALPKR